MREETALGHPQIVGEPADGQPFEAFERRQIDGALEEAGAGAGAFHAKAGRSFISSVCAARNSAGHGLALTFTIERSPRAYATLPFSLESTKPYVQAYASSSFTQRSTRRTVPAGTAPSCSM